MTQKRAAPYRSNAEHVVDELRWLDDVLALRTQISGASGWTGSPTTQLMYISHEEVDRLLGEKGSTESSTESGSSTPATPAARLRGAHPGQDRAKSRGTGVYLALHDLAQLFGLSGFETAPSSSAWPRADRKYDKFYAYLQDDITRKRPSVDLILDLACETTTTARRPCDADRSGALVRAEIAQKYRRSGESFGFERPGAVPRASTRGC